MANDALQTSRTGDARDREGYEVQGSSPRRVEQ